MSGVTRDLWAEPSLPPESGQTAGARESTGWLTDELSQSQISQSVSPQGYVSYMGIVSCAI